MGHIIEGLPSVLQCFAQNVHLWSSECGRHLQALLLQWRPPPDVNKAFCSLTCCILNGALRHVLCQMVKFYLPWCKIIGI